MFCYAIQAKKGQQCQIQLCDSILQQLCEQTFLQVRNLLNTLCAT